MKKLAVAAAFLFLLIAGLWFIAIPEHLIIDLIEGSVSADSTYIKTEGFKKGLFYNFTAERVVLNQKNTAGGPDNQLLSFTDVKARLNPASLLKFNPSISFKCSLNGGTIEGEAGIKTHGHIRLDAADIRINNIPFFEILGIRGDGRLSGNLWYSKGQGKIKMTINDLMLRSASLGTAFLPLEIFREIRGVMTIRGQTIDIQSFAMHGEGVSARLKGLAKGKHLDMNLEVMMDSSYKPNMLVEAMLGPYRISPGYYAIPIKTFLDL